MASPNDITKYFKEVPEKTSIGFRQLVKKEEEKDVDSVLSNILSATNVSDNGANFFDMIGNLPGSSKTDDKRYDEFTKRFTSPENQLPFPGRLTDRERSLAAWIPSEATRKILIAMVTSPTGSYHQDMENLTMPGVVLEEDMQDTVKEAINRYLGPEEAAKRKVLTANDVTQDHQGLRTLANAGCYRAAVNLTKSLLTMYGQGSGRAGHPSKHTMHSIQLWHVRFLLLVKLKSFMVAEVEAEAFGDLDRPDMFLQFYPELYGGRLGSLVPFSFRLLIAQIPMHVKKYQLCLEKLYKLLAVVKKIVGNLENGLLEDGTPCDLNPDCKEESLKIWRSREIKILHSIANCSLSSEDYTLTIEVLNCLISKSQDPGEIANLQSGLGRILLQLGDITSAKNLFLKHREWCGGMNYTRCLVDTGLLHLASNKPSEALAVFEEATKINPTDVMILNNISVLLLYLGRRNEAVERLENGIKAYPALALDESYIFNLCTLYELQSEQGRNSKLNLLALIGKYRGDNVSISCLKLEPWVNG